MKTLPLLLCLSLVTMTNAQTPPHSPAPDSAEAKAIATTVRAAVARELKQDVAIDLDVVNISGDWAFATANLVDTNGGAYRYKGTPLEEAAAAGGVSNLYAGLLKHRDGAWSVTTQAIGPTDLAWEDWPQRFGAPTSLFATD